MEEAARFPQPAAEAVEASFPLQEAAEPSPQPELEGAAAQPLPPEREAAAEPFPQPGAEVGSLHRLAGAGAAERLARPAEQPHLQEAVVAVVGAAR